MKTYLDCIPCFFRQALAAARISGADRKLQKRILNRLAGLLPGFPLSASPPEMGRTIYGLVEEMTGKNDIFKEIKEKSNRLAMGFYPVLKKKVSVSDDGLLTALKLAIAGNVIDYGVKNSLNIEEELKKILEHKNVKKENKAFFDYTEFKRALKDAGVVLYLADNAGEVVFDRILIEEIRRLYNRKRIIYAVKERPVINDALAGDAHECGIDKIAEIVSCGADAPGTVLRLCSVSFLKIYKEADIVISKGQGNFEVLSEEKRPVFFLFMVKCPVVAGDVGCDVGDMVLLSGLQKADPARGKTYALLITLGGHEVIPVGRLGDVDFKKGLYLYVGSARKNMNARIQRHLGKDKKKFWHIDYLLSSGNSRIKDIWTSPIERECRTARALSEEGYRFVDKFGSSDCDCRSHLFRIPLLAGIAGVRRLLADNGFVVWTPTSRE